MKTLKRILLGFVIIIAATACLWFGRFKVEEISSHKKIADINSYMKTVDDIKISDNVNVVAIGEAAHGCKDFQELKLSVLKKMVKDYDFRAFALEADYGECATINRYIQGGDGDIESIVKTFSFPIYRTKQMEELISWMREYNSTVSEGEKLRFYGFDMQNPETSYEFLKNYCISKGLTSAEEFDKNLDCIEKGEISVESAKAVIDFVTGVKEKIGDIDVANADDRDAVFELNTVRQSMETFTNSNESYYTLRDNDMAGNIEAVLDIEKKIGSGKLLIAAHDGHIAKIGNGYTSMGAVLSNDLKDAYYSIGTDFWKVTDNIKVLEKKKRSIQSFISADPLAAQARFAKDKQYLLDFSDIKEGDSLYSLINSPLRMGSLGEGYTWMMRIVQSSYRPKAMPSGLYDAMIFVYEGSPIEIIE